MATHALVMAQDDLAPLVGLSLEHHHVPVSAVFNVFEEATNERFLGIATPVLEDRGAQETYFKVFTALQDETFSTQTFLRLHTLLLSAAELDAIRKLLKKGSTVARLSKLAHLDDVLVCPVESASEILKSGMLTIGASPNRAFQIIFAPLDGSGFVKSASVQNLSQLKQRLRMLGSEFAFDLNDLARTGSESKVVTCTLDLLYSAGLA